jgi:hypothetical protein
MRVDAEGRGRARRRRAAALTKLLRRHGKIALAGQKPLAIFFDSTK